jgi:serine/threonine-protein kinase HipA
MGARPKVVAGASPDFTHLVTGASSIPQGYSHWLIKFSADADRPDAGAIEIAYAAMARAAGIDFPRTHLFTTRDGRGHFGVERFDRDLLLPSRRIHTHTFAGLLHHDHRIPGQDYHDLLKLTRVLTRNHQDVVEAFRRMVFNILAHNRDDHTKNFAFLMSRAGEWRLAPAYDVTFSHGPGGEHTLLVAGEGREPTRASIEVVATRASLERREVRETIERVRDAVATWDAVAKEFGVSAGSRGEIGRRLAGQLATGR